MTIITDLLLKIQLVPASCWFSNVRSHVSKYQWDLIRKQVYLDANYKCQICNGVGPKHPVEAHEIWEYDDKSLIQKLIGMIALCPSCHMTVHMGFAQIQGKGEAALSHFMKVNKINKKEASKYLEEAFKKWAVRSKKKWKLDISILKQYDIDTNKIKENEYTKQ